MKLLEASRWPLLLFDFGKVNLTLSNRRKIGKETETYPKIAEAVDCLPGEMLFLSDIVDELIAADAAGFQTVQLVRPGTEANWNHTVKDFSELDLKNTIKIHISLSINCLTI